MRSHAEVYITRVSRSIIHAKAAQLLRRHARKAKTGFIRLNEAYLVFAVHFHLNKKESWTLLKEMRELGLIRIAKQAGVYLREEALK